MTNKFIHLYNFVELAKNNRKYPESTANNLKSALKIFENQLNTNELNSIFLVEDSIEEIFKSVVSANKNKSIESLNTYKARVLKVINDYKKYGQDPGKIQSWVVKSKKSTPLLIRKDKTDKTQISLSNPAHTPVNNVHKIEIALDSNDKAIIFIPKSITRLEANTLKAVIDSLVDKS